MMVLVLLSLLILPVQAQDEGDALVTEQVTEVIESTSEATEPAIATVEATEAMMPTETAEATEVVVVIPPDAGPSEPSVPIGAGTDSLWQPVIVVLALVAMFIAALLFVRNIIMDMLPRLADSVPIEVHQKDIEAFLNIAGKQVALAGGSILDRVEEAVERTPRKDDDALFEKFEPTIRKMLDSLSTHQLEEELALRKREMGGDFTTEPPPSAD